MVRFATILGLCVTAPYLMSQVNGRAKRMIPEDRGVHNAAIAYDSVCWWEFLKQIPTDSDSHRLCDGKGALSRNWVMEAYKNDQTTKVRQFAKNVKDHGMTGQLPEDYNQCTQFLDDKNAAPAADESEAFKDSSNEYPFRAFTYCLLHTLRERHGDEAVEDVKAERINHKKRWTDSLLEQQNKLRARHGVEPLTLNDELSEGAQEWAEVNAKECDPHHSADEARKYHGEFVGENIYAVKKLLGDLDDPETAAYVAADSWYEEIRDYPYPQGYQGDNHDEQFTAITHFTQSVWKDSKSVGYGYAWNQDCAGQGKNTVYVIGRYHPGGNIVGNYPKNVMPQE